ncbi:MAG: hypothetical protein AAAC50_07205, partial [Rhizobium altiplani]|uniref:hypothetical protein n=1 Tax=Rhizobium altiplani TaxID=1864509 RepID=UPI0030F2A9BE
SQSISAANTSCGNHGSQLCSDCGVLAFPCLIRASRRPVDDTSLAILRIPMKPAIDSDLKPASHSDFIPAGIPI